MEEEVQVRVQVEVGREEKGEGETHGEGQNEEKTKRETINRSPWMAWRWNDARMRTPEPCGVIHIMKHVRCAREK